MTILITGATGFIGQALCKSLHNRGHTLCVLTRDIPQAKKRLPFKNISFIASLNEISPMSEFKAVINLAGAPIVKRWTPEYKAEIIRSRVELTKQLIDVLKTLNVKPKVLISGSAIGYYVPGFSHELCQAWEQAALKATQLGIRVCLIRTSIVLGPHGGALSRMRMPFLLGLGGEMGTGEQWMPWIHLEDMIRIIHFCLENDNVEGPLVAAAPNVVTNREFTKIYGKVLHRPTALHMPACVLKLIFGEMANELLLTGPKVFPEELLKYGFEFKHPQLEGALLSIKH